MASQKTHVGNQSGKYKRAKTKMDAAKQVDETKIYCNAQTRKLCLAHMCRRPARSRTRWGRAGNLPRRAQRPCPTRRPWLLQGQPCITHYDRTHNKPFQGHKLRGHTSSGFRCHLLSVERSLSMQHCRAARAPLARLCTASAPQAKCIYELVQHSP